MATQPFESVRQALSRVDPNTAQDILRALAFGDVLRAAPVYLRSVAPAASVAQQLATLDTVVLPEDAKAAVILRCTVKAGGTTGEFAAQAYGATPTTGQVAVAPNGDIVFVHATDLVTSADIVYVPEKGDVLGQLANNNATQNTALGSAGFGTGITSLPLAVVPGTGVCALPSAYAGKTILLMQANATAGTTTGQKIILVPASSAPATGKAVLNIAKTQILFAVADAVSSCTVDILVAAGLAGGADVNAILEAANTQYA